MLVLTLGLWVSELIVSNSGRLQCRVPIMLLSNDIQSTKKNIPGLPNLTNAKQNHHKGRYSLPSSFHNLAIMANKCWYNVMVEPENKAIEGGVDDDNLV